MTTQRKAAKEPHRLEGSCAKWVVPVCCGAEHISWPAVGWRSGLQEAEASQDRPTKNTTSNPRTHTHKTIMQYIVWTITFHISNMGSQKKLIRNFKKYRKTKKQCFFFYLRWSENIYLGWKSDAVTLWLYYSPITMKRGKVNFHF